MQYSIMAFGIDCETNLICAVNLLQVVETAEEDREAELEGIQNHIEENWLWARDHGYDFIELIEMNKGMPRYAYRYYGPQVGWTGMKVTEDYKYWRPYRA